MSEQGASRLEHGPVCPICDGAAIKPIVRGLKNRRGHDLGVYDLYRCTACDVAFLSPRPGPEMLSRMYANEYHSHAPAFEGGGIYKAIRAACLLPYRLRFGPETGTFPPFGSGRLLDVGCGTGDYLAAMSVLGWRCAGCDVARGAIAAAQVKVPGATLHQGALEDGPFAPESFDAVTFWHSLEHLSDPLRTLKRTRDLLVPGGRVLVAVPNIDSVEARVFGRRWLELDVPGHLFCFSLSTLRLLLEKAGFELVRARPQVHPSTVSDSVDFLLDDVLETTQARQRRWLYYALFPFTVASYVLGNWGCIELAAVKGSAT